MLATVVELQWLNETTWKVVAVFHPNVDPATELENFMADLVAEDIFERSAGRFKGSFPVCRFQAQRRELLADECVQWAPRAGRLAARMLAPNCIHGVSTRDECPRCASGFTLSARDRRK